MMCESYEIGCKKSSGNELDEDEETLYLNLLEMVQSIRQTLNLKSYQLCDIFFRLQFDGSNLFLLLIITFYIQWNSVITNSVITNTRLYRKLGYNEHSVISKTRL